MARLLHLSDLHFGAHDPVVVEAFLRIPMGRLEEITGHYEHMTSGGAVGAPALAQAH